MTSRQQRRSCYHCAEAGHFQIEEDLENSNDSRLLHTYSFNRNPADWCNKKTQPHLLCWQAFATCPASLRVCSTNSSKSACCLICALLYGKSGKLTGPSSCKTHTVAELVKPTCPSNNYEVLQVCVLVAERQPEKSELGHRLMQLSPHQHNGPRTHMCKRSPGIQVVECRQTTSHPCK